MSGARGVVSGARVELGVTSIEFLIGVMLIVLPLVAAIFELTQLTVSRYALGYAVSQAARSASMGETDALALRQSIAVHLLSLQLRQRESSLLPSAEAVAILAENARPDLLWISLEAWPAEQRQPQQGRLEQDQAGVSTLVRQRLQVKYCRELFFWPVKQALPALLRFGTIDLFDQACLLRERLPLRAWAPVLRPTWQSLSVSTPPVGDQFE